MRMPGVIPNFGSTCLKSSIPVSLPVEASTPPIISSALTAVGSILLPLTLSFVLLPTLCLPAAVREMTTLPSESNSAR